MLKNYIKIAWRNLIKGKLHSMVNVMGLTIGIACCLLISIYIVHELNYDNHFDDSDRIYRIAWFSENPQTRTPHPMAQALVKDFPEVQAATSISPIWGPGLTRPVFSIRHQEKRFDEKGIFSADSTFFEVFSFDLLYGDKNQALQQPGGIVLTQEMAEKYFSGENPMGKTLRINEQMELTVTGVMKNIPDNTHFHFDFLISYVSMKLNASESSEYYTWADFGHFNYMKLGPEADAEQLEKKMTAWSDQYINWTESERQKLQEGSIGFRLQPITDIHLYSDLRWELEANGNIAYIYIFFGAALFILIIACINFMNLSTARSLTRAKEVGLRKSAGASRSQLIMQFLAESFLMTGISVLLAFGIVDYLLPWFNEYSGIKSSLSWSDWKVWAGGALAVFTLGMISGSYPAFVMSKYNPTRVLKGKFSGSREGVWLRKALVVLQFSVSVVMIAGTLLIYEQLDYLDQKDLGFQKEQIVVVPIKGDHVRNRYIALKDQLSVISGVTRVTAVSNYPGGSFNQQPIQWNTNDQRISVSVLRTDFNFSEMLDINVVEGRSFSQEYGEDRGGTYLLNETAAQQFDWDDPIGNEITFFDDEITRRGKVIGIVEDFHFQSLHQTVSPLLIQVMPDEFNYVLVKLQPENVSQQLASIEETWVKFDPLFAFEYSFLDAEFEANYLKEQKAGSILFMFSALAIFIAALGLLGLTSFAVQHRIKEIGVRKILGASIASIVALLSKDFVKLVVLGFVIAIPIAWYTMNQWLADFAYRIEIGAGNFILAGAAALLIAMITVSWQAIKAAVSNPVDSLRS